MISPASTAGQDPHRTRTDSAENVMTEHQQTGPKGSYESQVRAEKDEWNLVLDQIRARLAAGTISLPRLQIITGLDNQQLQSLLDFGMVSVGLSAYNETRTAIQDLSDWIRDADHPPEDNSSYAVTPTFQSLQNLFSAAHEYKMLIAITGSWGIGKTQAALYYAATHPRTYDKPGAVRIQFDGTDCKPVAALEKIRDALSANPGSHRRGNVMNAIGTALRPGDFLILEECQRMGEALDIICSLHDEFGVGIAMIGNPDLSVAVWGKRETFGALASRANRFDFPCTTPDDVDAWLAWHGLPERLSSQDRARLAKVAVSIAARPGRSGGLRALGDAFNLLEKIFPGQPITGELLSEMAKAVKPTV